MKEISEQEMQAYVEGFKARAALQKARRRELQTRAMQAVSRWVEKLRSITAVERIILYGSLAKNTFHEGSDIDLVVEGLPADTHFRVWSELDRDEDFNLDLHRWEELSDGFRSVIQSYGRVLYARP